MTAKLLSTLISMTLAYFAHRYWSFSHRARTGVRREYVLFTLINGGALLLGMAVVAVVRYPLGQDSAAGAADRERDRDRAEHRAALPRLPALGVPRARDRRAVPTRPRARRVVA